VYFKSKEHEKSFNGLVIRAGQGNDSEYTAAVYVLSALGKRIEKYVLPGEIKYPALFRVAKVWSSSEKALLKLSATLFNAGAWSAKIGDTFHHLDAENREVAIEAIKIRYHI